MSSDESQESVYNPEDDIEEPTVYEKQKEFRNRGEKIPRRYRTHNTKTAAKFCEKWPKSHGMRELIQNFLDGLCSTDKHTSMEDIAFHFTKKGSEAHKTWSMTWIAKLKRRPFEERGKIVWDRKKNTICLENKNVSLNESVLFVGVTSKGGDNRYIGQHGEGMNGGILRLILGESDVIYYTNAQSWTFYIDCDREFEIDTLFYKTRDIKETNDTKVRITNITQDDFEVWKYLDLCREEVKQVPNDGKFGCLLEPIRGNAQYKYKKCLFMKGMFVRKYENIVPVNLLQCELNRDRNFASDKVEGHIAEVWDGTLSAEGRKDVNNRKYTKKLLELCKTSQFCVEHRCVEFMSQRSGKLLFAYLKGVKGPDVFPYVEKQVDDRKKIVEILKKKPYKCSEALYNLLLEDPQVKTVEKAIEEDFIQAENAPDWVQKKPIARMMQDCINLISRKIPSLLKQVFFKRNCNLHMTMQHHKLYVNMNAVIGTETIEKFLQLLTSLEYELTLAKGVSDQQKRYIAFLCKLFIANTDLNVYLKETSEGIEKSPIEPNDAQVEDRKETEPETTSATAAPGAKKKLGEGLRDQPIQEQRQPTSVNGSLANNAIQSDKQGDNTQENQPATSTNIADPSKQPSQISPQHNTPNENENREHQTNQIAGSNVEVIEVDSPDAGDVMEPVRKQARLDTTPENLDKGHLRMHSKFDSLLLSGDDLELKWPHPGTMSFERMLDEKKKIVLNIRKDK